jgi:hypothetical protein
VKLGHLAGLAVSALFASGALAFSLPPALSPLSGMPGGFAEAFECEDLIEGDRVELRNDADRSEIRVEADTRVRAEARFQEADRRARVEFCGVLQFVDEDGGGTLSPGDRVVRSDFVAFGAIDHEVLDGVHQFSTASAAGGVAVGLRVPVTTSAEAPLIAWTLVANPSCEGDATHFAVKVEQDRPGSRDRFLTAACGTELSVADQVA